MDRGTSRGQPATREAPELAGLHECRGRREGGASGRDPLCPSHSLPPPRWNFSVKQDGVGGGGEGRGERALGSLPRREDSPPRHSPRGGQGPGTTTRFFLAPPRSHFGRPRARDAFPRGGECAGRWGWKGPCSQSYQVMSRGWEPRWPLSLPVGLDLYFKNTSRAPSFSPLSPLQLSLIRSKVA